MFQDEAGFGRISEPANCWAPPKCRPSAPCQRIREYKPVYGAVSPADGESYFVVLEKCNSENMTIYLKGLSERFQDDLILLCMDKASYHTSKLLTVPGNIQCFFIPPRTPEMNPVELMW
jgi:putative transposase